MILFISDVHFVDETAGKHNILTPAFEGVFEDLKRYTGEPSEIRIVFLGDIFDLNRTTHWLDVPEAERPWGDLQRNRDRIEAHANAIMDGILNCETNRGTFELLGGSLKKFGFESEPERIYIPGNHDRLCNMFDSLRIKVRKGLGMPPGPDPFPHAYDDAQFGGKYKVFARHGHEYDVWNYEGTDSFSDSDYAQTPIGDLITTEIAARLPWTIMKRVEAMRPPLPPDQKEHLKRNLEEIENVRPYSAMFDWLFYQVSENRHLKAEINEGLQEIVENFESLEYLSRWYKRHDKWNLFSMDEADKLQSAIRLFRLFGVDAAEGLMKVFSKIFGSPDELPLDNSDKVLTDKAREFLSRRSDCRYMLMGHTHNPLQVPVRITSGGVEQMYLNTGTWRAKYVKGLAGGFIGLKNLTYNIVYSEAEDKRQQFETWTGSLKEAS